MPRRVRPGAATRGGGLALVDEEDLLGHIGQVGEDAAHKVGRVDVELEQAERRCCIWNGVPTTIGVQLVFFVLYVFLVIVIVTDVEHLRVQRVLGLFHEFLPGECVQLA